MLCKKIQERETEVEWSSRNSSSIAAAAALGQANNVIHCTFQCEHVKVRHFLFCLYKANGPGFARRYFGLQMLAIEQLYGGLNDKKGQDENKKQLIMELLKSVR